MTKSGDPERVQALIETSPPEVRAKLFGLRRLILETAARIEGVGPLTETLKWGEPAYLTEASRSGSTIRLGWKPKRPEQVALYFNCRTSLVDDFRSLFPALNYEGNRAIVLAADEEIPENELASCIATALTYHRRKASQAKA